MLVLAWYLKFGQLIILTIVLTIYNIDLQKVASYWLYHMGMSQRTKGGVSKSKPLLPKLLGLV